MVDLQLVKRVVNLREQASQMSDNAKAHANGYKFVMYLSETAGALDEAHRSSVWLNLAPG